VVAKACHFEKLGLLREIITYQHSYFARVPGGIVTGEHREEHDTAEALLKPYGSTGRRVRWNRNIAKQGRAS